MSKECYVYVVAEPDSARNFGPVKIGVAVNPWARVNELQTGNGRRLHLSGTFKLPSRSHAFTLENAVLTYLKEWRTIGEWIDLNPAGVCGLVESYIEAWRNSPAFETGRAPATWRLINP